MKIILAFWNCRQCRCLWGKFIHIRNLCPESQKCAKLLMLFMFSANCKRWFSVQSLENLSKIRLTARFTMKLLTHNMLSSKGIKGVKIGFPLKIEARDVKECEVDFNPEFTSRVIPKLDWPEVVRAAQVLGQLGDTPAEIPSVRFKLPLQILLNNTTLKNLPFSLSAQSQSRYRR